MTACHVNVAHMWIFAEIYIFFVECVEHNGTCILACYHECGVHMCALQELHVDTY